MRLPPLSRKTFAVLLVIVTIAGIAAAGLEGKLRSDADTRCIDCRPDPVPTVQTLQLEPPEQNGTSTAEGETAEFELNLSGLQVRSLHLSIRWTDDPASEPDTVSVSLKGPQGEEATTEGATSPLTLKLAADLPPAPKDGDGTEADPAPLNNTAGWVLTVTVVDAGDQCAFKARPPCLFILVDPGVTWELSGSYEALVAGDEGPIR